MADGDLTTLANVKEWLKITGDTADALLTRLVTAVSQFIQSWIDRRIASRDYTEVRDGHGGHRLAFANYPVTAVASVKVDGVAIPAAADSRASGYQFDETMLTLKGYRFTRGYGNVELAYTAGYETTPPDLEQACIELVSLRFAEKDRVGQVSKNLEGQTITFSLKDMPADVKTLLEGYRKVVPV